MSIRSQWTFFSNHGHVLIYLSRNPEVPLRQVATDVGITERAVQRIVADLEEAQYLIRERKGRQNVYTLKTEEKLRHPMEQHHTIGEMLQNLSD